MIPANPYESDLAYIHDRGFGDFARGAAPGLLKLFQQNGVTSGRVVDLGCGSGIWAQKLAQSGYQVTGVDLSPAMIELARRRVPEATFLVGSFLKFRIPECRAVTALGEVFNYLFDPTNSLRSLRGVCERIFDALAPDGLLVFDVAEPGRCRGLTRRFVEGEDWVCLVEYEHDVARKRLTRRIVSFRKSGQTFRRHEESHPQQLYKGTSVARMLRSLGFRVRLMRSYGNYLLPDAVVGIAARKPSC